MEPLFDINPSELKFRFENTRHKLGIRIWGDRKSFHDLHELLNCCWDCGDPIMTRAETCSYIGIISYFSYEVRHAFMGSRLVLLDGRPVKEWSDEIFKLFEEEQDRIEVGMELSWPHMLFIMASWWECLKHQDCPAGVTVVMRQFTEGIENLLLSRSKMQYPAIEPYIHGAIYAANPYLMHFMEHINYEYISGSRYSKASLTSLADLMLYSAYESYPYIELMTTLKKHAKKLGCSIEDMTTKGGDWIYDIEL